MSIDFSSSFFAPDARPKISRIEMNGKFAYAVVEFKGISFAARVSKRLAKELKKLNNKS